MSPLFKPALFANSELISAALSQVSDENRRGSS